jgi:hypothetical protein
MNEQDKSHLDSLLNKFEQMLAEETVKAVKAAGGDAPTDQAILKTSI